MTPAAASIDFSAMELVPHPSASLNSMSLNVSASGHVAMNQRLYEQVVKRVPSLDLEFRIRADCTLLALRISDSPTYKFPKGGRIKDAAFSRRLVSAGISLPARYAMTWDPAANAWVGTLENTVQSSMARALEKSLKSTVKQKKGQ
ncbi:hypothetical protein [uncultured Dysosmobacter sp.]|uniref:hypothetical protein n=1 Tax=uncultured Dysosmobacter sp. TaxID=2591384 RepID=UPI00260CEFAE|nr:hypothetical protein [uncultured Dysosmobacter sp.]